MKKTLIVSVLIIAVNAIAMPVEVTQSLPVTSQVVPALTAINATLAQIAATEFQIGSAINQNSDKLAAMLEETAKTQRDYDTFARKTERLETARRSYTVPDSLCSESTSGMVAQVAASSTAMQSRLVGGSGIANKNIQTAITTSAEPLDQEQFRAAAIHADYCSAAEHAVYGGTPLCPKIADLPGGDNELRSVLSGAGKSGNPPVLTFTQAQTDAAMMYLKNTTQRSAGDQLKKGEAKTATGQQYAGLLNQHQAIQSAAAHPQLAMIAASQASPQTTAVLKEALQTPSAAAYFAQHASPEAKRTAALSERELEFFEVGRRYANTDYLTDLQAMEGDNLLREAIRIQNLQNWLLFGIKQQLQESNIINGQQLGLSADQEFRPLLQQKRQQISAGVSRNG
ncbi:conjugal transfer protein TraW [Candidatus Fukatsuia symbiotica]|nr:conjugal transfer protein TraW [Candidatus Fukatsuia symbiotica]MEA9445872.1 conjugal transfer protein TraW [Candidatus Fukatsuia symbiotica]MEA9446085.1 conjugal transfer protein TraW [Candidatus Fukatsuia symbiotica]